MASRVDAWADELRTESASARRRREQWLRRQAADDATVAGVLVDHAERGSVLAVTTVAGSRHVGRVLGAGSEVLVMAVTGATAAVDVAAIDTITALPSAAPSAQPAVGGAHHDPLGHRTGAEGTTMAEVLALVVGERPEVTLVTRSGRHVAGELVAVGRDVVLVRPPERAPLVYAPLASVSEALLAASTGSG